MLSILRREFAEYFHSPIGYVFLAAFYFFSGTSFYSRNLVSQSANLSSVFNDLFTYILFLVPVLTMRLLSEDRKSKTDQALLTAPVTIIGIVLGKFFAATFIFLLALLVTPAYAIVIAAITPIKWGSFLGSFISMFLLGEVIISIGLFISSLTENQIIAAIGSFTTAITLILVDLLSTVAPQPWLRTILNNISLFQRYSSFSFGIFEFSSIFFFFSICCLFLFLTTRVFDKRRWN